MPETYKSFGTILGSTAATSIYSGVTPGTALVNSVNISNGSTGYGNFITVELLKGSTAYSIITSATLPVGSSLQVLDSPLVLESSNSLRCTAGYTYPVHAIVSVMEIT
jgi:hypothetical protein